MLLIESNSLSPYFNIASEEYLFKNFDEDIILIYVDSPSVISGKHQNILAEVNYPYLVENNIPMIRRISGGGTVYHDLNNLNFSFFQKGDNRDIFNFKRFSGYISEFLLNLGLNPETGKRNDLFIEGLKVSGNAQHTFKNKVLFHGTLLFDSDLKELSETLKKSSGIYKDRGVRSVRSKIANIRDFIKKDMNIKTFKKELIDFFSDKFRSKNYSLTSEDIYAIERLVDEKFDKDEWTFGRPEKYIFEGRFADTNNDLEFEICVNKRKINKFLIKRNKSELKNKWLENQPVGSNHEYGELIKFFGHDPELRKAGIAPKDFVRKLF